MAKVATNEKLIGYDTNGKKLITAHFICDSQSDLPVQTEYDDYILYLGCTAHCISEHTNHELQSGGVWVQKVQSPADYDLLTNRPQINGHILTGNKTGNDLGLQNTLSFDSTPTRDSANPVTSGGIWTDQQRQDYMQSEDRAALVELIDNGAKNLLNFDSVGNGGAVWGSTYTHNGITYTINGNGTVSAYGTTPENDNSFGYLGKSGSRAGIDALCNGKNILSGCPSGGSLSTWRMYVTRSGYGNFSDTGEGVLLPDRSSFSGIFICCFVSKSTTIPQDYPIIFNPMICTSAAWKISQTFQPYRPSWQEMYNMILALQ